MTTPDPLVTKLEELERELQKLKVKTDAQAVNDTAQFTKLGTELKSLKEIEESQKLGETLEALALQVKQLKERLPQPQRGLGSFLKSLPQSIQTNWTLLAFCAAVLIALFVNWRYEVGYFESYKNISDTKKSALYYKQIGDSLIPRAEFKAAEGFYKTALEINPNYIEARRGLMKTQVLTPVEGYNDYTPVVAEAKINYLEQISPGDYLVPYFRGILKVKQNDQTAARVLFNDSLNKEAKFIGSRMQLGYLDLFAGDINSATQNFDKALQQVPNHPLALNGLGTCYMLARNFNPAIARLEESIKISPRLETWLNLGEAYRNTGDFKTAAFKHERALEQLQDPKLNEDANDALGFFNYLPTKKRPDAFKIYQPVSNLTQYRTLIYYALSIDYALDQKFLEAERAFDEGFKTDQVIDGEKALGCFYLNRLDFLRDTIRSSGRVEGWFGKKRRQLDPKGSCDF
jgi:tetratricopeptide (TPR) repeat protein